jgi:hypothetical protein
MLIARDGRLHSNLSEPRLIELASQAPVSHDTNVGDREQIVDGLRWALVQYEVDAGRADWCDTPHVGYVISGAINYEFDDGRAGLEVSSGQGFLLPASPRHRGRNLGVEPARLFLIDSELAPPD